MRRVGSPGFATGCPWQCARHVVVADDVQGSPYAQELCRQTVEHMLAAEEGVGSCCPALHVPPPWVKPAV